MKKVIYFIVPAVLSYAITMFLLWILLVPMTGLFSEFDIILFTFVSVATIIPIAVMSAIYQVIRAMIDKDYINRVSQITTDSSPSEVIEEILRTREVRNKYNSGDYEGARRLQEHFEEIDALKEIAKNTRK